MFEEDKKIYEEQRKKVAQSFIDEFDYFSDLLDCMIDVASPDKKDELLDFKFKMQNRIKDLYPIVEEDNKKKR